jgi:hypothetical protein
MKMRAFAVGVALLQACSAEQDDVGASWAEEAKWDRCARGGQFDIQVWSDEASAWQGRKVVVAAIENDIDASPRISRRVALLTTVIKDGKFSLFCPRSLHENYGYPSWAAFVDVNGDGRCSAGDVGYQEQLFGWNWDTAAELDASWWSPVTSLAAPIGTGASDFCTGYFK